MIDDLIYGALCDPSLDAYFKTGTAHRVYPRGALGFGSNASRPDFMYVMYGESQSFSVLQVRDTLRKARRTNYDVYVYDSPGSFLRIKEVLPIVVENVCGLMGHLSASGDRVSDVIFTGYGQDGFDTVLEQNTKTASFRFLIGS